jgi:phosphoglycolate phosphatase
MSLILFDFDGVLADTLDDMLLFAQQTCDELGVHHHVIQTDLSGLETMSFATFGQACEVPQELVGEFVRKCTRKFAEKKSPPEIFDGLSDVIRQLAQAHVIAVVTGNTVENVNAFLRHHGLVDCVRAVYGVDMPGSKVEKILQARNQFAAKGEIVWMVGDSVSDIRAAKAAGVSSIAVGWGHQSQNMLLGAEPDAFISFPAEIWDVVVGKSHKT